MPIIRRPGLVDVWKLPDYDQQTGFVRPAPGKLPLNIDQMPAHTRMEFAGHQRAGDLDGMQTFLRTNGYDDSERSAIVAINGRPVIFSGGDPRNADAYRNDPRFVQNYGGNSEDPNLPDPPPRQVDASTVRLWWETPGCETPRTPTEKEEAAATLARWTAVTSKLSPRARAAREALVSRMIDAAAAKAGPNSVGYEDRQRLSQVLLLLPNQWLCEAKIFESGISPWLRVSVYTRRGNIEFAQVSDLRRLETLPGPYSGWETPGRDLYDPDRDLYAEAEALDLGMYGLVDHTTPGNAPSTPAISAPAISAPAVQESTTPVVPTPLEPMRLGRQVNVDSVLRAAEQGPGISENTVAQLDTALGSDVSSYQAYELAYWLNAARNGHMTAEGRSALEALVRKHANKIDPSYLSDLTRRGWVVPS